MSEHKQRDDRLTALEERFAKLEQILDTNTSVFSDSLQLAEICIQAMQRAFDDNLNSQLKTIELVPERTDVAGLPGYREDLPIRGKLGVDFKAYLRDAMEQRMATTKVEPVENTTPAAHEDDQVVFEFGG